jgi:hypothetical protein
MLRWVVWGFLIALCSIPATARNSGPLPSRKPLPLDTAPGVVLKSAGDKDYLPDRLIVKMMPGKRSADVSASLAKVSAYSVEPLFPDGMVRANKTTVDLSLFYVIR